MKIRPGYPWGQGIEGWTKEIYKADYVEDDKVIYSVQITVPNGTPKEKIVKVFEGLNESL